MKINVKITRCYDDGMEIVEHTQISEEQYRDIDLISLFMIDNYRKSALHKIMRFMNWFYRKIWWK